MPRKKKVPAAQGSTAESQNQGVSKHILSKQDREEIQRINSEIAELKSEIARDSNLVAELRAGIAHKKEKLSTILILRQNLLRPPATSDRLL